MRKLAMSTEKKDVEEKLIDEDKKLEPKHFIAPQRLPECLKNIREKYATALNIKVEDVHVKNQSWFPGTTNFKERVPMIEFLEKFADALPKVLPCDLATLKLSEENVKNYTDAQRLLMAACIYIQEQVKDEYYTPSVRSPNKRSQLYTAICQAMGVNGQRDIDKESIQACLFAARKLLKSDDLIERLNAELAKQKKVEFTDSEIRAFKDFVKEQTKSLPKDFKSKYPFAARLGPAFGSASRVPGWAFGAVLGTIFSQSTGTLTTKTRASSIVAGGITFYMGAQTLGGSMVAAPIAIQLVETLFTVTAAYVTGKAFEYTGMATGYGIGMALDLSYQSICKVCELLNCTLNGKHKLNILDISGVDVVTGEIYINGIPMEIIPNAPKVDGDETHKIEIKDENTFGVTIGEKELTFTFDPDDKDSIADAQKLFAQQATEALKAMHEKKEAKESKTSSSLI
jgi:hypothetical protein